MDQRPGAAIESVPDTEEFLGDVIAGLSATPRTLPCKYFYDQEGSRLFDAICDLDEYYLTRTEIAILEAEIAGFGASGRNGGWCFAGFPLSPTELTERYGEQVDFVSWIADLELDALVTMTVGELVTFVAASIDGPAES